MGFQSELEAFSFPWIVYIVFKIISKGFTPLFLRFQSFIHLENISIFYTNSGSSFIFLPVPWHPLLESCSFSTEPKCRLNFYADQGCAPGLSRCSLPPTARRLPPPQWPGLRACEPACALRGRALPPRSLLPVEKIELLCESDCFM